MIFFFIWSTPDNVRISGNLSFFLISFRFLISKTQMLRMICSNPINLYNRLKMWKAIKTKIFTTCLCFICFSGSLFQSRACVLRCLYTYFKRWHQIFSLKFNLDQPTTNLKTEKRSLVLSENWLGYQWPCL